MTTNFGEPEYISDLSSDAKSDDLSTFVHYPNKCGRFSKKEWMESGVHPPFSFSSQLVKENGLTLNEQQVFKIWNQVQLTYEGMR